MAVHAPITGAPTRASAFNRRAILGALTAAGAVGFSSVAFAEPARETTGWDQALAAVRAAEVALDQAAAAEDDAGFAYDDACEAIRPAGLIEFKWAPISYQLGKMPLGEIAGLYSEPHVAAPEGHGAMIAGKVSAYRDQCAALEPSFRLDELTAARTNAGAEWTEKNHAALMEPAPTIAALADKLALFLLCDPTDEQKNAAIADARRLAGAH